MYQYSKTTPGRKPGKSSYFWPFIIIALSAGIIWAGWSLVSRLWLGGQMETSQAQAQLSIDSGSVKAMTSGDETWTSVPNGIKLYEGEKVKVGPDGQASLLFSPEIEVRLSRSSEVALTELKQKEDRYDVSLEVAKGSVWASLKSLAPSDSNFQIKTEFLTITGDSSKFAVTAPGTVYMIEGEASVEVSDGEEALKSVTLRVGQQITVDEQVIAGLKTDSSKDLISQLDETFKRSIFYIWNAQEEGWSTVMDEGKEEVDDNNDSEEKDKTEEDSDAVKEDEKTTTTETTKEDKEENEDKKEETIVTGKVEITSPSKETQYESKTFDFDLKASVPSNTAKVTINNSYTLSQYKAGNTTAVYYVREKNANVKEGSNSYTVTAYDKDDKKIGEDTITVKVAATPTTTSPSVTPGTVSIVAPSANPTYESSTTDFALKASVPSNTAKVIVNDYTLSQYTAGSTTATYNVRKSNGNVKEGLNTYKVTAYDDKGAVIGSDTIEITVKASVAPPTSATNTTPSVSTDGLSFSYPVSSGSPAYTTSLNPLPIGGTIGSKYRWLYVNDVALDSHSLGNTSWSKSVELKPGLNTIKIMAEDEQHNTTSVKTITVDYQVQ